MSLNADIITFKFSSLARDWTLEVGEHRVFGNGSPQQGPGQSPDVVTWGEAPRSQIEA